MEYVLVGKIVSTHGIKGEVKIKSGSDFKDERYKKGAKLYIKKNNNYVELIVNSYRSHKNMDLVSFKGYENINLVLEFMNLDIYALVDLDEALGEDEFYFSQLIGLNVYVDNKLIGKVLDIVEYPQADYLEILKQDKKKSYVPFLNEFIENVNLEEKRIDIVNMEGLL